MTCYQDDAWRGFDDKFINVLRQLRVLYDVILKKNSE